MGIDLASGSGAVSGLMQGIQMALQTQNMLEETAIKKKLANAQGIDAFSKLYSVSGKDNADQYARKFGLLPPQAAASPESPPADNSSAPDNSSPGATDITPETQPQIGPSSSLGPASSQGSGAASLIPKNFNNMSAREQAMYMPKIEAQLKSQGELATPQGQLAYQKAQLEFQKMKEQSPEEGRNLKFGTRSANSEFSDQYKQDPAVKIAKASQVAMQQMIDNYQNPTPQGDASLILNAFHIKFPNAPDVNSLEEIAHSQSAPDRYRNAANLALNGALTQDTRDNLLRDGISTFRANVRGLHGAQKKINDRLKQAGIQDPTLAAEPSVDDTWQQAQALQNKVGPYVANKDRGGLLGKVAGLLSGSNFGGSTAQAKEPPAQDPDILKWAKQHGLDYGVASRIIKDRPNAPSR